jgi:hypothetical protein
LLRRSLAFPLDNYLQFGLYAVGAVEESNIS